MPTTDDICECVKKAVEGYPVKNVKIFGSYAEGTQTEESDVDLLVEFSSSHVSLFVISGLQIKMQELWGRDVDLIHAPIPENSLIDIGRTISVYEA